MAGTSTNKSKAQDSKDKAPETAQQHAEQEAQPVTPPSPSDADKVPAEASQSKDGTAAVNEGKDEPQAPGERTAQEATPVAPPSEEALASTSGTDALTTEAAPLAGPVEDSAKFSTAPRALGLGEGNVNDIAVGVGLQSRTGERTGGLVDEDGNALDFKSTLDYGDGTATFVTVRKRVYETFYLPGSSRPLTRLLYGDGARISREVAAAVKAASEA